MSLRSVVSGRLQTRYRSTLPYIKSEKLIKLLFTKFLFLFYIWVSSVEDVRLKAEAGYIQEPYAHHPNEPYLP